MWILIGMTGVLLVISSISDIKCRKVSWPLIGLITLIALLFKGYKGSWWMGYLELAIRIIPGLIWLMISLFRKKDLGIGDAVMVISSGYILGAYNNMIMIFLASIIGGSYSAVLLLLKKKDKKDTIAYAPFLLMGLLGLCLYKLIYLKV